MNTTDIFLLLDQGVGQLEVFGLQVEGGLGPPDLKPYMRLPSDVKESFKAATLAAYNAICEMGVASPYSYYSYTVDDETASRIYGKSAALAFAIAITYQMLGVECQESIGATGMIDPASGTVQPVNAIHEKITIAFDNLPSNSTILYPFDNDSEVSAELKQEAIEKGIKLKPVKTLDDVLFALKLRSVSESNGTSKEHSDQKHGTGKNHGSGKNKRIAIAAMAGLLMVYLFYGLVSQRLAVFLLENEYYALARWHIHLASLVIFYNNDMTQIARDFEAPLEAQSIFSLRYSTGREETYPIDLIPPVFQLNSRDMLAFRVEPREPVYVYIIEYEGDGSFKKLYPYNAQEDTVLSSATRIPPVGVFFRLEGKPGNRDIYVVLSRWKCKVLEKVISSIQSDFSFPGNLSKYGLEEQCIQVKKVSVSLDRSDSAS